jgi:uncharacterized membrane protein (DUF106 family)
MSEVDSAAGLSLIGYACLSAAACELVSWLLVYRHADFERISSNFLKASKHLQKKKDEATSTTAKGGKGGKDKKLIQLEKQFELCNRDLMQLNSRSGMLTAIMHMLAFFSLKTHYDGIVVARLPFEPFGFIKGISHRNLPGNDVTHCGMIFLYMLCSMGIKPNLQRMLGHTPPKSKIPTGAQKLADRWAEAIAGPTK